MFDHAYATRPPQLEAQRAEMAARLRDADGPGAGATEPPAPADARTAHEPPERDGQAEHGQGAQPGAPAGDGARRATSLVIGEDVGVDGGVFRVTEDLHRKFGGSA